MALDLQVLTPIFEEIFLFQLALGFPLPSARFSRLVEDLAPNHHIIFLLQLATFPLRAFSWHQVLPPVLEEILLLQKGLFPFSNSHILSVLLALQNFPLGQGAGWLLEVEPPILEDVPIAPNGRLLFGDSGVALKDFASIL